MLASLYPQLANGFFDARPVETRHRYSGGYRMLLEDRLSAGMAAAQGGDGAAYRAVLRECLPLIAAAVRSQGLTGAAVDDAVQETLITLHHARQTYDPSRPFLPWLRAIAKRRAIDALRRQGRQPKEAHDPIAYEAHADGSALPGAMIEASDRKRLLAAAILDLPPGQREAVEHLALAEKSLEEAASITGRSKVALKVNLHRALKALRQRLAGDRERGDV